MRLTRQGVFVFSPFLLYGLLALALSVPMVFANLGERHRWARITLYVLLGLYALLMLLTGGGIGLVTVLMAVRPEDFIGAAQSVSIEQMFSVMLAALGIGGATVFLLIPPVRRWFFRFLPANPASMPHLFGAVLFVTVLTNYVLNLTAFYDIEKILEELKNTPLLPSVFSLFIFILYLTFMGTGLFMRRSWKETLARLGLERLSFKQVMAAIGLGGVLLVGLLLLSVFVIRPLDPEGFAMGQRFEAAMRLEGAPWMVFLVSLGVALSAGIGEELMFRGVLQPVFGILPATLLFALIHSHYGFSILMVQVFILGLVFAWIRKRYNTTAAIITHATYDVMALVLTSLFHL